MEEDIKKKSLIEEIRELKRERENSERDVKVKKVKAPRKSRVKKKKLKDSNIGVMKIDVNRNITFEKQRVVGSSYRDSDGNYHALKGDNIFFFDGKYPMVIQPTWKENPVDLDKEKQKDETFGQRYIMARMLSDAIKIKNKRNTSIIIWIIVAGVAIVGLDYLTGGTLFG